MLLIMNWILFSTAVEISVRQILILRGPFDTKALMRILLIWFIHSCTVLSAATLNNKILLTNWKNQVKINHATTNCSTICLIKMSIYWIWTLFRKLLPSILKCSTILCWGKVSYQLSILKWWNLATSRFHPTVLQPELLRKFVLQRKLTTRTKNI